jgi:branched-chain amino acid transport system permease protein
MGEGVPEFSQLLWSGLTAGTSYALIALGLMLLYRISGIVNFAQGGFAMLAGMTALSLGAAGLPLPAAALCAIAVAALAALALYGCTAGSTRAAAPVTLMLVTVGMAVLLRGLAAGLAGREAHSLPPFTGTPSWIVAGISVPAHDALALVAGALIVLVLWFAMSRTLTGKAMTAIAANRLGAQLSGINVGAVTMLAFVLSGMLAAAAGLLLASGATSDESGVGFVLKALAALMLGGIGRPFGAVAGGLIVGLLESFGARYLSPGYGDAIAPLVILAVLFVMPRGSSGRPADGRA